MSACRVVNIPGTPGAAGAAGAPGAAGISPFSTLTAGFTMPAIGLPVVITVGSTAWMVPGYAIGTVDHVVGQILIVEFAGYFEVELVIDETHAQIVNLGYDGNSPAGTLIPLGSRVSVGGLRGP